MTKAAANAEQEEGPPCKPSLGAPPVSFEEVENTPCVTAVAGDLQVAEKPAAEAAEKEGPPPLQHDLAEPGGPPQGPPEATAASEAAEESGDLRQGAPQKKRRRLHGDEAAREASDGDSETTSAASTAAAAAAAAATAARAEHYYSGRGRGKRFRGGGGPRHGRNNNLMHPRSRFFGGPLNFALLAEKHPPLSSFLSVSPSGHLSYDFSSREAQLQLCTALFRCIYSLSFSLPPDQSFLVPTLPNRSNYIHFLADLLSPTEGLKPPRGPPIPGGAPYILKEGAPHGGSAAAHLQSAPDVCCSEASTLQPAEGGAGEEGEGGPPRGPQVRVLDVGVGASCVYPLLGVADYDWSFVGSDINAESLSAAAANVKANALEARISLRQQAERNHIFRGVVRDTDPLFAASVCNPPFYASEEELGINPRREKGGSTDELVCEGGEEAFLTRMLSESKTFCCNFLWFTTLVARATTRDRLKREIHAGMRKTRKQQELLLQGIAESWLNASRQGDSTKGICLEVSSFLRSRGTGAEMQKAAFLASVLIICSDHHGRSGVNAIPLKTQMPELPIDLIYDRVNHKFKLLPDPEEMADRLTDGSAKQKEVFFQLYNSAMKDFDLKGYNWLLDTAPGLSMVAVMSLMMVKGLVQSVASTVMDIVPPAIPPPVWINQ
ncbi:hypothetical protein Emed_004975 [Eimeria media]